MNKVTTEAQWLWYLCAPFFQYTVPFSMPLAECSCYFLRTRCMKSVLYPSQTEILYINSYYSGSSSWSPTQSPSMQTTPVLFFFVHCSKLKTRWCNLCNLETFTSSAQTSIYGFSLPPSSPSWQMPAPCLYLSEPFSPDSKYIWTGSSKPQQGRKTVEPQDITDCHNTWAGETCYMWVVVGGGGGGKKSPSFSQKIHA